MSSEREIVEAVQPWISDVARLRKVRDALLAELDRLREALEALLEGFAGAACAEDREGHTLLDEAFGSTDWAWNRAFNAAKAARRVLAGEGGTR